MKRLYLHLGVAACLLAETTAAPPSVDAYASKPKAEWGQTGLRIGPASISGTTGTPTITWKWMEPWKKKGEPITFPNNRTELVTGQLCWKPGVPLRREDNGVYTMDVTDKETTYKDVATVSIEFEQPEVTLKTEFLFKKPDGTLVESFSDQWTIQEQFDKYGRLLDEHHPKHNGGLKVQQGLYEVFMRVTVLTGEGPFQWGAENYGSIPTNWRTLPNFSWDDYTTIDPAATWTTTAVFQAESGGSSIVNGVVGNNYFKIVEKKIVSATDAVNTTGHWTFTVEENGIPNLNNVRRWGNGSSGMRTTVVAVGGDPIPLKGP